MVDNFIAMFNPLKPAGTTKVKRNENLMIDFPKLFSGKISGDDKRKSNTSTKEIQKVMKRDKLDRIMMWFLYHASIFEAMERQLNRYYDTERSENYVEERDQRERRNGAAGPATSPGAGERK